MGPTSSFLSQASALSMSSFLPPSAASPRCSALRGGPLHKLCPAGSRSSKVGLLQEKSRSWVRTTSIMSGHRCCGLVICRNALLCLAVSRLFGSPASSVCHGISSGEFQRLISDPLSISLHLFHPSPILHCPPFYLPSVSPTLQASSLVNRHH